MNAPKVTIEHINETVSGVMFIQPEGTTLTICVLTLKNGTHVVDTSACVSPANFNKKIGQDIAYKNAIEKIWDLEGYLLKQKLWEAEQNA